MPNKAMQTDSRYAVTADRQGVMQICRALSNLRLGRQ